MMDFDRRLGREQGNLYTEQGWQEVSEQVSDGRTPYFMDHEQGTRLVRLEKGRVMRILLEAWGKVPY